MSPVATVSPIEAALSPARATISPAIASADCYYTATKDSKTYYRFPFPTLKEGGFHNYVGSSYVKSHTNDSIVNAMYVNILLNSAADDSEVKRIIDGAENFECYVFEIK